MDFGLDLDKLQRELERYEFAEANLLRSWRDSILLENGKVKDIVVSANVGIGIRVLIRGSFGFSFSTDPRNWKLALKEAVKVAKANPKPMKSKLSKEEVYQDKWVVRPRKSLDVSIDEKTGLVQETHKSLEVPRKIKDIQIHYVDVRARKLYLNTEGAFISQSYPRTRVSISATAKSNFVISAFESIGGLYGLEIFDKIDGKFQDAVDNAKNLLKAKRAPVGKYPAILDPHAAGVFAHEAVGHACEADEIVNGISILKDKLGERIGSEYVTIVDDATIPRSYGSYGYDYEGVPGQRTVLIENGILKGFMHSRETASELGTKSTGNARASGVSRFPLVRMSNTFFEKGDYSLEEMLEDIKEGIYIYSSTGGVTDPNSGFFQFTAQHGYWIENGEIKQMLRDVTFSGNFLDILHNVEKVGKELKVGGAGLCGKSGQSVPVGDGGPHVFVKEVLLG